jgi:hypothetical protein
MSIEEFINILCQTDNTGGLKLKVDATSNDLSDILTTSDPVYGRRVKVDVSGITSVIESPFNPIDSPISVGDTYQQAFEKAQGQIDAIDTLINGFVPYTGATADVDLGVYKLVADAVEFSLTPVNAPGAGQIAYKGNTGALAYLMNSSAVECEIGQQMYAYVHNADSVQINKGDAVYLFGASGNKASVKRAYNTSETTSARTLGLAAENIAVNQKGFVICQGVIENVNTGSYSDGNPLYLGSTPGSWTNVLPYAPNHYVQLGIVEQASVGNGKIYVRVQNGFQLDELSDVDITTIPPVAGDVLTYNGSLWVAAESTGGGATSKLFNYYNFI